MTPQDAGAGGTGRIAFDLDGALVVTSAPPATRLSHVLRDRLRQFGSKVGCEAGDCGACTVLVDGRQVCACLTAVGQVHGRDVRTVEGLAARDGTPHRLQAAFLAHGAAQCGICTPGMLMAAAELLRATARPTEAEAREALSGVLCRCTGYAKIVAAVLAAAEPGPLAAPEPLTGAAVGARVARVDGLPKVLGTERFGDDSWPPHALMVRAIRSPYPRARFRFGDLDAFVAARPGLVRALTAADVPGANRYGIYPVGKDQPVLADGEVRHRGEAVAAVVGEADVVEALRDADFPIVWEPLEPLTDMDAALAPGAHALHPETAPGNVLVRGRVARGDVDAALAAPDGVQVSGAFRTRHVEHAYIEPEAGWARRIGDGIEVVACTQTPYLDRDELALILGLPAEAVRIIPAATGGGFGGKLDLSVQPLIALAAWLTGEPCRMRWSRPESMAASTKRHPAEIVATLAATPDGRLTALDFAGDFDTGAYASWGPTVANRVPAHASGPYRVPAVRALTRAVHTNGPIAGAFRGFGVPQAVVATEQLMDMLAERLGLDPWEIRRRNVLVRGDATSTGQILTHSVGIAACLDALRPRWTAARAAAEAFNAGATGPIRRGAGIACMWYGIGNTALSNPSTIRVGLAADGRLTLYNGAVDIGQGSATVLAQIVADALGVPLARLRVVSGDTALTADAGKTSASRQTFVSGQAALRAAHDLRARILRLVNAGDDAALEIGPDRLRVAELGHERTAPLRFLGGQADANGDVLIGEGRFDPPTTPLDADGQGSPYAAYAFGAQIAEIAVDMELGVTTVMRVTAAHDVGRAVNPTLIEGQIEGGVAQGLGLALMEEYVAGRTDNLHDYLIPTIGDVPPVETILIEDPDPLGPFGAKGVGEPALIPTAPAILNALAHATGVRLTEIPATPARVRAAILARGLKT